MVQLSPTISLTEQEAAQKVVLYNLAGFPLISTLFDLVTRRTNVLLRVYARLYTQSPRIFVYSMEQVPGRGASSLFH